MTGYGETWVFLDDGKKGFTKDAARLPRLDNCKGYHAELVDLNKDGKAELISSFAGEASPLLAPGRCPSGGAIQAWQFSAPGPNVEPKVVEKTPDTP